MHCIIITSTVALGSELFKKKVIYVPLLITIAYNFVVTLMMYNHYKTVLKSKIVYLHC